MSSGSRVLFDRSRLRIRPLSDRVHDLRMDSVAALEPTADVRPELREAAEAVLEARRRGRPVVLFMGAHVIRSGVQRYLIDLMRRGLVTCVAGNGACAIHDYELARIGATTESVARYIRRGEFGFWEETGEINDVVREGAAAGLGLGEAVGRAIEAGGFPHGEISVLAAGVRHDVPVTIHVGIGCDILHQHPSFDGAAYGAASYHDFLVLAAIFEDLEGGVVMNFGSAVTGPEVFLKALAMARNVAEGEGRSIRRFTTLVSDLVRLPADYRSEPPRDDARYFFRPWKTMLVRTVADGGRSIYVCGRHAQTIPELWTGLGAAGATTGGR